jgi:hypothetical protein
MSTSPRGRNFFSKIASKTVRSERNIILKINSASHTGRGKGVLLASVFVILSVTMGTPFPFLLGPFLAPTLIPRVLAARVRNETEADDLRIANWGICNYPQNSCSSDVRCQLNDTVITAAGKPVPDWGEPGIRNLFDKTVAEHGKAYGPWEKPISSVFASSNTDRQVGRVCKSQKGVEWYWSTLESRLYNEFCYTAYVSLGFHPWEKREGWWLAQIVGQSIPGNGWGGGNLYLPHTLKGDFYVNITRVWDWPGADVGNPVDGSLDFLDPADNYTAHTSRSWEKAGRSWDRANSTRRTDQDISANGFDYGCCENYTMSASKIMNCQSYTVLHQGCSIGGDAPYTNNSQYDHSLSAENPTCPGAKKISGSSRVVASATTVGVFALAFIAMFA